MVYTFIEGIKDLLISPVESFEKLRHSSLRQAYLQYVILLIVYSLLLGIMFVISYQMVLTSYQTQLATIPFIGSVLAMKLDLLKPLLISWSFFLVYLWFLLLMYFIFIKGLFLHAFVFLLGGEQGLSKTFQVILFAATPYLLLGWIPHLWIIGLIWSAVLWVIGIKIFQELSWERAVATIIVPLLLGVIGILLGGIFPFSFLDVLLSTS